MPLLDLVKVSAGYGHRRVLHGVDLCVEEGEIVAILGANGAGKTTTLRAISGAIHRAGQITFLGRSLLGSSASDAARLGIAHVPEGRGTMGQLTVLLVEHHMNLVMSISHQVVVLSFGRKIAEGEPDEVRNNPAVIEAYLGATGAAA